jgi:hypothetical protein
MPSALSCRIRASTAGFTVRLPSFVPFALALASPGIHTFPDVAALELREVAQHLEHGLARAGRRVEPLLVQEEIDALVVITIPSIISACAAKGRPLSASRHRFTIMEIDAALPYSRDRYCCYRAHRDFICDAFRMAYRLIVDRSTPARPLDREGRVLFATRRKDCLPIELSIQMPDRHDRCGPTNRQTAAAYRLLTSQLELIFLELRISTTEPSAPTVLMGPVPFSRAKPDITTHFMLSSFL